jgi:predicted esterase
MDLVRDELTLFPYVNSSLKLPLKPRCPAPITSIRGANPTKPPLVPLHGSGGDERELEPLAVDVAPGSPIPRGSCGIPFNGGFAFFHRLADRSIDEADIASRPRPSLSASPMEPSWQRPCS